MICSCGGWTRAQKLKNGAAALSFQTCGACGRCDGFTLIVCGRVVSHSELARRAFNDPGVVAAIESRIMRMEDRP